MFLNIKALSLFFCANFISTLFYTNVKGLGCDELDIFVNISEHTSKMAA